MRVWASVVAIGAIVLFLASGRSVAEAMPTAAAFSVDTTEDSVDAAPGDGACEDAAGQCSLRAAVAETNALPGADTITLPAGTYELTLPENPEGHLVVTDDLTVTGEGASATIITQPAGIAAPTRIFEIPCGNISTQTQIEISRVAISNGQARAGGGGAIHNCGMVLRLHEVALTENRAETNGGALQSELFYGEGNASRYDRVTIDNSLFSGNSADTGGAIHLSGGLPSFHSLTNVTISGNTATGNTAAIRGAAALQNVTIAENTDLRPQDENGWPSQIAGQFAPVKNTLLYATGTTRNCQMSDQFYSTGKDTLLFEEIHPDTSNGQSCLTPQDHFMYANPRLGPLVNYGGTTQTHALMADSPAINAGTNDGCPATDQRGVARPQEGTCDIGAYEYQSLPATPAPTAVPEEARALPQTGGDAKGNGPRFALAALGLTLLGGVVAGYWLRRRNGVAQ